ncbi:MAG: aldehyde ferredoxin oxidoreductase [Thermoproteota archaeon]|mgnify:CR=1 FL=1|nr:MAG: aldehyde ferredoxin oxidoreductase [Candidatus Korarchaeota archaeon]
MFKGGWTGKILRVDLTREKHAVQDLDGEVARSFMGGRGLAVKILWDELKPGTDPLSPENKLILATGPLTGFALPSSGKLVVASKSPLTGGYGDGNIGTRASYQMKKAGYDAIVVEGRAKEPVVLVVEDSEIKLEKADDLWGKDTYTVQDELEEKHGKEAGILMVGPGAEKLIRFGVVISEKGRAGGRPGIGTVMASKNLKAVVIKGTKEIPAYNREELRELAAEGYKEIKASANYDFWVRQGTMATIEWSQENSVLPSYNFREGWFERADEISGTTMEKVYKVAQKGCPFCNMQCGNICEIKEGPYKGWRVEIDYENIAMLGSNLGIGSMDWAMTLNLYADLQGIDTITLGSVLAFTAELVEKRMLPEDKLGLKLRWGDGEAMLQLAELIAERKGFGEKLGEGVKALSKALGGEWFAMHIKGLEISAYDCHAAPGMALAFATSPIGAHHKDAWFIAWELKIGRDVISKEKVDRLLEMQRIRGGLFEAAVACRLPWIELGFSLEWYPKYLKAATGLDFTLKELYEMADRIYDLIRCFWAREHGGWSREMDYPPERWFKEPLTRGPLAGSKLSKEAYDKLLSWYYEARGWDSRGLPRKSTLRERGLGYVAEQLEAQGMKLEE